MLLKNTASQLVHVGSLLNSSNARLTSSATVRWCKDGTWEDGGGTLSVEETDQWKYAPTQSETNCSQWAAAFDHASAVQPIVLSGRTMLTNVGDLAAQTVANIWTSNPLRIAGSGPISSVVSQTVFTPTNGPQNFDNQIQAGAMAVLTDDGTGGIWISRVVSYIASTNRVTIDSAPPFTITTDTVVEFFAAPKQTNDTYNIVQGISNNQITLTDEGEENLQQWCSSNESGATMDDSGRGSGGGPFLQRKVGPAHILIARDGGDGTFGVIGTLHQQKNTGPITWAVELAGTKVPAGGTIDTMSPPAVGGADAAHATVGAIAGEEYGTNNTRLLFELTLSDSATTADVINITIPFAVNAGEGDSIVIPVTVSN